LKKLILIMLLLLMIVGLLSLSGCTIPNQSNPNNDTLNPPALPEGDGIINNTNNTDTPSPPALPE